MTQAAIRLRVCREISGFDDVSQRFADSAFEHLAKFHDPGEVDRLLAVYGKCGIEAVAAGKRDGPARTLIGFLYTGALPGAAECVAEDYFESLMWRAILAHPPALSGGYFGHWRYPPEDMRDGGS